MLDNLRRVQERNGISTSDALDGMNFSVEMETGTGKTYVYLRTIFELHKTYGFTKFVIVVPSIAIREGVLASIDLLSDHLTGMYLEPVRRVGVRLEAARSCPSVRDCEHDPAPRDEHPGVPEGRRGRTPTRRRRTSSTGRRTGCRAGGRSSSSRRPDPS